MPKYGIHHIVLQEAISELRLASNPTYRAAADILSNSNNTPMASLGSIGPDLFFWGTDYKEIHKLYKLHENIESIVGIYDSIVAPIRRIKEEVGEVVEDLVETLAPNTVELIRNLVEEIQETASLFNSAISTGIFAGVVEGVDLINDAAGFAPVANRFFQLFKPDLNTNENTWKWFDMLHYRKTGDFGRNLAISASNERQKAYAFGYLSHIATDVIGHPFVNVIVGAPYRLNPHRHVTVENYMDTWAFREYFGESINETLFERLNLPENLPTDIGDLLHSTFQNTYSSGTHPPFYTRGQIDEAYNLFYDVLKLMERMSVNRPEEPFSGAADILSDALGEFFDSFPSPPSSPSGDCSWEDTLSFGFTSKSRACYRAFFEDVGDWLDYLGELIEWGTKALISLVDLVLQVLLSLPIIVLLAILYGIQLLCYNLYRSARMVLSTQGFVMPEPDELDNSIARNLTTFYYPCFSHQFDPHLPIYPLNGGSNNLICTDPDFHITNREDPPTYPMIVHGTSEAERLAITPYYFMKDKPIDENTAHALIMYHRASNPEETRELLLPPNMFELGNATFLSFLMIGAANGDPSNPDNDNIFTNWNLDGDRGYAYKTWSGEILEDPYRVEGEAYID